MRSHTKFGHDRFSRSDVYWKQTDRKAKSLKESGVNCLCLLSLKINIFINKLFVNISFRIHTGCPNKHGN